MKTKRPQEVCFTICHPQYFFHFLLSEHFKGQSNYLIYSHSCYHHPQITKLMYIFSAFIEIY